MPFVQVHTSRLIAPAPRRKFGCALAKAYGEHMRTTHRIVNVAFNLHDDGDVARYDAADDTAQEMVIVTCDVRTGREPAAIEGLGRAITDLCAQHLGIAPLRVAVYVTEHPATHIYRDGGVAPAWTPAEVR